MTAQDNSNNYTIRLPDYFWQRLIDLKYMANNLGPRTLKVFEAAQKVKVGGGHSRFIRGNQRVLCRILTQLHTLVSEIRSGEYRSRETFGAGLGDIDRWAHQRIKATTNLNIIPVPDPPEA